VYDGHHLPFAGGQFHLVVLVYVLHHAKSPNTLVEEAARVTGGRIIILESICTNQVQRAILTVLDHIVNYVRSSGRMTASQHKLDFRTLNEWTNTFRAAGLNVEVARDLGGLIHRRALFVLSKTSGTVG
jgi:ubiquinone/menaquinone biosynthesis C-methylase UbiE